MSTNMELSPKPSHFFDIGLRRGTTASHQPITCRVDRHRFAPFPRSLTVSRGQASFRTVVWSYRFVKIVDREARTNGATK